MDNFGNDSLSHDDDDDWPMGGADSGRVLSEVEMKDKVKNVARKYLKKIKTLQENKRRQDTRIERLTRENRSIREKIGVQAAYLDVLCGFLGEDAREKLTGGHGRDKTYPAELVDRVKESVMSSGAIVDQPLGVKSVEENDNCSVESTPPASLPVDHSLSHHHHHQLPSFSSGLLQLDHDHNEDTFVADLDDDGDMSDNHLYCIEDISQQDSSSLFIC